MADKIVLGEETADLVYGKKYAEYSKVILNFDTETQDGQSVEAGEDGGTVMDVPLFAVTNSTYAAEIAEDILEHLQGLLYQPYSATEAMIDPAFELGDWASMGDVYGIIASADEICDALYSADISSRDESETDNEFIFQPSSERSIERKIAQSSASLRVDIDRIIGEVSGIAPAYVPGTQYAKNKIVYNDGKYWKCVVNQSSTTWVSSEWAEQSNGAMSSIISQTLGAIVLSAVAGENQSTIQITADGVSFDTAVVEFSSITADKIKTGTLDATDITLNGLLKVMADTTQGGYLGYGYGNNGQSNTSGVVLASSKKATYGSSDHYLIVTESGVRMQSGNNAIYAVAGGVHKVVNGVDTEIGEAVFG